MAEKFIPPAVPNDASPPVRQYLDEQMRRLAVIVNNEEPEFTGVTLSGGRLWVDSGTLKYTDPDGNDFTVDVTAV